MGNKKKTSEKRQIPRISIFTFSNFTSVKHFRQLCLFIAWRDFFDAEKLCECNFYSFLFIINNKVYFLKRRLLRVAFLSWYCKWNVWITSKLFMSFSAIKYMIVIWQKSVGAWKQKFQMWQIILNTEKFWL